MYYNAAAAADVYMLWGDRQAPLWRHFGGVAPAALQNLYSTVMCGRQPSAVIGNWDMANL